MNEHFRLGALILSLCVPLAALAALPVSRRWARKLPGGLPGPTVLALALAVALVWIEAGAILLAFIHALTPIWILTWMALGVAAAQVVSRRGTPLTGAAPLELAKVWGFPGTAGVALVSVLLLEATVPPWFQDDMVYHLSLARWFAQHHGYAPMDDNIFQAFPLGWESILAAFHAFGHAPEHFAPFNPRLLTVWTAAGAALATAGLAEIAGAPRRAAAWCGVALLLVPTFAEFATLCYVEAYLVLLAVLGLTFLVRVIEGESAFIWGAAILAGLSATVKYTGLAVCAGFALLLALRLVRGRGPEVTGALIRFVAIGGLTGAVFYVRNQVERGNPVFPLAHGFFGGKGWDDWRAVNYAGILDHYGEGRGLVDYALLPLRLLTSHNVNSELRTGEGPGFEASLGPLVALGALAGIALFVPRIRAAFARGRAVITIALFAGVWFLFWALTTQQGRMFLVAVPPLLVLAVVGLSMLVAKRPAPGRALIGVVAAATVAWAVPSEAKRWSYQETSDWLIGRKSADQILGQLLHDTYPVQQWMSANKIVPADARVWLVWMHDYTYYLRCNFVEDQIFEGYRFAGLLDEAKDPREFAEALDRFGVGFVLINKEFFLADESEDTEPGRTVRLRARFSGVLAAGALSPLGSFGDVDLYAVHAR